MTSPSAYYANRKTDFVPASTYTPDAISHRAEWIETARPKQITPKGDWWSVWLNLAGRGYGKTRVGAEDYFWYAFRNPNTRLGIVAPTHGDVRDTVFEGESGLLAVIPPSLIPKGGYVRTLSELTLVNGVIIKGYSATEPNRLRGPQFHRMWFDEWAAFESNYQGCAQECLETMDFALRLGDDPRLIITTTPKPFEALRDMIKREDVYISSGSTYDNKENLPKKFFQNVTKYEGTRLGDQELHAKILDNEDLGIIKRSWFKLWPADKKLPKIEFVLVSWDTAFTEKTTEKKDKGKKHQPDPTAWHVYALFLDIHGRGNVLVMDVQQDHLGYPDLEEKAEEASKSKWGKRLVDLMLIEQKGSGISLIQSLQKKKIAVYPYNPGNADKLMRLHLVSNVLKQGRVWLLESENAPGKSKSWYQPMLDQVCTFIGEGSIKHDDHVDTLTQALRYFGDANLISLISIPEEQKKRAAEMAVVAEQAGVSNPYAA